MLIHETSGIIDTECIIEININSFMAENLKIIGKSYAVFLKEEAESTFMETFIDSSLRESLITNPESFESVSGYLLYTERLDNNLILKFMKSVSKIKTAMLHQPYLKDGKLYIPVSYRHNFSKEISDAILSIVTIPKLVSNVTITPVNSTMDILKIRNKERPIMIVKFTLPASLTPDQELIKIMKDADSLGRVVNSFGNDDRFQIALLTKKPLPTNKSIEKIPDIENGYWVNLISPFFGEVLKKANARGINLDINYISMEQNRIAITQFVPKMRAMEYIQMLYNTSLETMKANNLSIELISEFNDYILQYI
jgi:hypothetical protein